MLAIVRIDQPSDGPEFMDKAEAALGAFAGCKGFERGWFARSTDEPGAWVLATVWDSFGSYRRALSAYDVKVHAAPFMYAARNEPSGFEPRLIAVPGAVSRRDGDLSDDAHRTDIGDFGPRSR
ncbi:hypothetical protein CLV47_12812 [Antricoccus suffuscus]|uniref:Antibiotic biosynthesis monooxygenase n=1 Tax=Antricoccus suffuscus TaxID=1629062 RepID=A0A2T0Z5E1_9ACTN|nr:antibiotic biosynthesis monooxygenase [Antricoccus suffuscus]PRZ31374.1 hypothetical protein CLV47_12812 [Antricoccus suffuscus]